APPCSFPFSYPFLIARLLLVIMSAGPPRSAGSAAGRQLEPSRFLPEPERVRDRTDLGYQPRTTGLGSPAPRRWSDRPSWWQSGALNDPSCPRAARTPSPRTQPTPHPPSQLSATGSRSRGAA